MAAKSDAADNDDKCITNHIAAPFRTPPQLSTFLEMVIGTDSIVGIDIILVIPGPYPPTYRICKPHLRFMNCIWTSLAISGSASEDNDLHPRHLGRQIKTALVRSPERPIVRTIRRRLSWSGEVTFWA
ncbi:hypothetical protein PG996_007845 [Apiospora saccharicola]|uniref:Uncharacterized protein n=1 Tax=Apiospora saccharicola TaxID=335842 RepID=A0ABR1UW98_9PEZI